MRPTTFARVTLLAALMVATFTPPASAYIDPTAAGAALQSMYVVGMSLLMGLALAPRKIANFFMRLFRRPRAQAPDAE